MLPNTRAISYKWLFKLDYNKIFRSSREGKMAPQLWKTVGWYLNRVNVDLPPDPVILLPGTYSQELKAGTQKYSHSLML